MSSSRSDERQTGRVLSRSMSTPGGGFEPPVTRGISPGRRRAPGRGECLAPSIADVELAQVALRRLPGHLHVDDPGRRRPVMAPGDQRLDLRALALRHGLDAAVPEVPDPALEPAEPLRLLH